MLCPRRHFRRHLVSGFIGNSANVLIENCYTAANVKNAVYGGALGVGGDAASAGAIANSYAAGRVLTASFTAALLPAARKKAFEKFQLLLFTLLPLAGINPAGPKSADFLKWKTLLFY